MKRLFLGLLCFSFLVISCKKVENDSTETKGSEAQQITEKDISKIDYTEFLLDEKSETYVSDWPEYKELSEELGNMRKGDFSYLIDNKEATKLTLENLKEEIPEVINSPAIQARMLAFETKFLKLESYYNLNAPSKEELLQLTKDVLVAFSYLNLQINKKVEFDNQNVNKP
ncbi:hypothetical protein [Seonamhaeicola sp. ML3]|uniref:hypothetical protein n=1 Tax=Seonamhaeicola sp. ML3 TaxID=2937786 RepID=UPI002010A10D|nr:hypothetical protein [Seonamhaeicola sp. ML3]